MKKIHGRQQVLFFLLNFLLVSFTSNAQQRLVDLSVICMSEGTIKNGEGLPLNFRIINNGPDALVAGDTLYYTIYTNDSGKYSRSYSSEVYTGPLFFTGTFDSGMYTDYADNYDIRFNIPDLTDSIVFDFCIALFSEGLYPNGDTFRLSHRDPDKLNNKDCKRVTIIPNTTSSANDIDLIEDFSIYPNPASSQISVSIPESQHEVYQLSISDLSGTIIYQKYMNKNVDVFRLDISHISPGLYIVSLKSKEQTISRKLVITR